MPCAASASRTPRKRSRARSLPAVMPGDHRELAVTEVEQVAG